MFLKVNTLHSGHHVRLQSGQPRLCTGSVTLAVPLWAGPAFPCLPRLPARTVGWAWVQDGWGQALLPTATRPDSWPPGSEGHSQERSWRRNMTDSAFQPGHQRARRSTISQKQETLGQMILKLNMNRWTRSRWKGRMGETLGEQRVHMGLWMGRL